MEDVEGLYTGLCSKRGRCKVGSCPWCNTVGVWMHNKVTYPGAVRHTALDDPLRRKWKKEFKDVPEYKVIHNKTKPERMTVLKANASADLVQAALRVGFIILHVTFCNCYVPFVIVMYLL